MPEGDAETSLKALPVSILLAPLNHINELFNVSETLYRATLTMPKSRLHYEKFDEYVEKAREASENPDHAYECVSSAFIDKCISAAEACHR